MPILCFWLATFRVTKKLSQHRNRRKAKMCPRQGWPFRKANKSDVEMPHTHQEPFHIVLVSFSHTQWSSLGRGGGRKSFPLVRRAAEMNFVDQSLLIAWGTLTSSFTVSVWTCSSSHKLPAGTSSGFPLEKSCTAGLRKDHNHSARC